MFNIVIRLQLQIPPWMNSRRTQKRDRSPLIEGGFPNEPALCYVGPSRPQTQEEKWRRAEEALEGELQSIKAVEYMPLDRWARWDKERAGRFCWAGEGGMTLQNRFRETDARVLSVMEGHQKRRVSCADVQLSISLTAKVEEVFLGPNIADSELMRMISPPHQFPRDRIGKDILIGYERQLLSGLHLQMTSG